jgi:hypothetical protein
MPDIRTETKAKHKMHFFVGDLIGWFGSSSSPAMVVCVYFSVINGDVVLQPNEQKNKREFST